MSSRAGPAYTAATHLISPIGTVVTLSFRRSMRTASTPLTALGLPYGGYGGILNRQEEALEGKKVGDRLELSLSVDDAWPLRPRSWSEPSLGLPRRRRRKTCCSKPKTLRLAKPCCAGNITAVDGDKVTIDANHPFVRPGRQVSRSKCTRCVPPRLKRSKPANCYDDEEEAQGRSPRLTSRHAGQP